MDTGRGQLKHPANINGGNKMPCLTLDLRTEEFSSGKSLIKERSVSETSPMPAGLLNALKAEQILDLLAFIEAGGDAKKPNFQP